jgi:hypothetical protein
MFMKKVFGKLWLKAKCYTIKLDSNIFEKRFKSIHVLDSRYLFAALFGSTTIGFVASSFFNYKLHAEENNFGHLNRIDRGKAIQLISENKNGKFSIESEALNFLKNLKGNVAVVNCVGPYRSGKSLLLNLFLNEKDGFKVGNTAKSCTRGIWIWNKPIKHKNKHGEFYLIFMDTEGIESPDSSTDKDNKIFVLSLLLSSVFIYNTNGVIDRNSIKKLVIMNQLSKYIKSEDSNQGFDNLPDFIWALRDYKFALQDTNPTKELEDLLTAESKTKLIHESIKKSFSSLECFYLPYPIGSGIDGMEFEETMRNLGRVDFGKLRPIFIDQVKSIYGSIKSKAKPKSVRSISSSTYIPLSAQAFSNYIENVVNSLNNNQLISIEDSTISSLKLVFKQILTNALEKYEKELDAELKNNILLDWNNFGSMTKRKAESNKNQLKTALNGENAISREYLEKFDENVSKLHEKKKEEHEVRMKTFYKQELSQIWDDLENVRKPSEKNKERVKRFRDARRELEQRYKSLNEVQPEKDDTYRKWCDDKKLDESENQYEIERKELQKIDDEKFCNNVIRYGVGGLSGLAIGFYFFFKCWKKD